MNIGHYFPSTRQTWFDLGTTGAIVVILFVLAWSDPARGHGDAEWIQRGSYRNTIGELCCGERDCFEVPSENVTPVEGGYRVVFQNDPKAPGYVEFVPNAEAQPSPDGHYWRCAWGGMRKCFFFPPPGV